MGTYLGIDLGTSGVKAILIDDDQQVQGTGWAPLTVQLPGPGHSEQDPSAWIAATRTAIDRLRDSNSRALAAVEGIGLSGQMHGAVLLAADDTVLRPCILWDDTRSHAEAARLDADPVFRDLSGNIVFPGFTAPKLLWLRSHEPTVFDRLAKVLLPKDYLRLWLAGEHVSEMSDAAGTSWLDTGKRRWSPELLERCGLGVGHMPRLVEGTEATGGLRPEIARRWGMKPGTVVAGGAGDNAASAMGTGTIRKGDAFVSIGTSGVLFAADDRYQPAPDSAVHTFCHALPNTWHKMGVILSATAALSWFSRLVGCASAALTEELGEILKPPGSVCFLPYFSGERTPHNDAFVRGVFAGLSHATGRAEMVRAILEGVAFALRDNLEALRAAGTDPETILAVGGGVRSGYWLKAIANALGMPVLLPSEGELGAAFGAARLGLIAATGADPLSVCRAPRIERSFEPETDLADVFEEGYQRFRSLYSAVSEAWPPISSK